MTKSEWSGWAQAIFSVVAIFAAIRIAGREQKLRRREAVNAAGVTAALVIEQMRGIRAGIGAVRTALNSLLLLPTDVFTRNRAAENLQRLMLPNEDQLLRLSVIKSADLETLVEVGARVERLGTQLKAIDWILEAKRNPSPNPSIESVVREELNGIERSVVRVETSLNEFLFNLHWTREYVESHWIQRTWNDFRQAIKRLFR